MEPQRPHEKQKILGTGTVQSSSQVTVCKSNNGMCMYMNFCGEEANACLPMGQVCL